MAEQVKAARSKSERKVESTETTETKSAQEKGAELKSAIDDILNDIDEILNEESVETVASYIQKGGQAVWVRIKSLLSPMPPVSFG